MSKAIGLFLLFLLHLEPASAQTYLGFIGGWSAHNQESMLDSQTRPNGVSYGLALGKRSGFYDFELGVTKGKLTTEITHDGEKNTLLQEQVQVSLGVNFYLLRHLYARLGYALTSIKQSTETPVSGASGVGLVKEYGLQEAKVDGVMIGGGWVLMDSSGFKIYTQYDYYLLPEIKATQHLMSVGLRWKID